MNNISISLPFELAPGFSTAQFEVRADGVYLHNPCDDAQCIESGYCCRYSRVWRKPPINHHQVSSLARLQNLIATGAFKEKFGVADEYVVDSVTRVQAAACEYAHSGTWARRMNIDVNVGTGHDMLRFWGLATFATYSAEEEALWKKATHMMKVAKKGMWRVTPEGREFLENKRDIDRHVWVATLGKHPEVVGYDIDPQWIGIGDVQE